MELEKEKELESADACEDEQLRLSVDEHLQGTDTGGSGPGKNARSTHRTDGVNHHMRNMEHEVEDTGYRILEKG